MIIIRLLKNIITAKKILKNGGRITHAFLLENRANTLENLIRLCKFMRVSASFWSNHKPHIRSKYIPHTNPFKAISIAAS